MSVLTNPTETGAVMGALFLLYLTLDKVAIPLIRDHLRGDHHNGAKVDHPHGGQPYICIAGRFEQRLSTLETQMTDTREDVAQAAGRLESTQETLGKVAGDVRVIRERVEWMFGNPNKQGVDR